MTETGAEAGIELSLLEQALVGRSDGFRTKVLDLVVRYRWDVNDPNFLILLATGQMEVLLEVLPEQLERIFEQTFQRIEQQRTSLAGVIQGVESTSATRTAELLEQVMALENLLAAERQRASTDITRLLQISKKEKEHLLAELNQRVKQLSAESHRATEQRASQLVETMAKTFQQRSGYESMAWVCLSVFMILSTGAGVGWMVRDRDFQAFRNDSNVWFGQRLVEWNLRDLSECRKQNRTTCNVQIAKPKEAQQ
jgi:hypothetical protein